jgi:L-aminopeptidase/D-esterase-like protein
MTNAPTKPRARDLGLAFPGQPGRFNAITDVPGVCVGQTTVIEGDGPLVPGKGPVRTGVTAILVILACAVQHVAYYATHAPRDFLVFQVLSLATK